MVTMALKRRKAPQGREAVPFEALTESEVNVTHKPAFGQVQANIGFPWWDAGCSVVPIRTDGTKRPTMPWTRLQHERLTSEEVSLEWGDDSPFGVAVICGEISGQLEMLELEGGWTGSDSLFAIEQAMTSEIAAVWHRLMLDGYVEWTPSGGLHLLYRISDHPVPGNTKIAQDPDLKTRAETRGTGGYVIVAPTSGACHPSGEAWEAINGGPETILSIGWDERCAVHAAIKAALDESPPPPPPRPARQLQLRPEGAITVGDDFSIRTDWADILEPAGWQLESQRGGERLWTRPGKDRRDGASASTDYMGKPGLYVWSTSAGLPSEEPLSKLFVLAHYEHGGDMRSAVKRLASEGFGTPLAPRLRSDTFMGTPEPSTEVAIAGDMGVASPETEPPQPFEVPRMDDSRAARFYLEHFPVEIAYVPEKKIWMFYENGVWRADSDDNRVRRTVSEIAEKIADAADNSTDKKYRTWARNAPNDARVNAAVRMMRYHAPVYAEQFDADRNLLNLKNGTLDLTSLELLPHRPEDYITKKMGAAFDPTATATRWEKYLDEVLPDKDTQDFLQRMIGYTMTGHPAERAMAVVHGPGGTGKSRFIEMMNNLMGTYSTTAAPSLFVSKFEGRGGGPSPDLNDLEGARMASMSELDRGVKMDESLVKRLTGLDSITSRGLYQENRTWMPRCVIWIASNHPFRVDSDDGAIWDRLKVIPFVQKIQHKDPYILDELMKESDGILNWMIEGLLKYRQRGLVEAPEVVTAVEFYRSDQDTVREFLVHNLDEGNLIHDLEGDGWIKPMDLFNMYVDFCKSERCTPLGRRRFYARFDSFGYLRYRAPGHTHPVYMGIHRPISRGIVGLME